MGTQRNISQMKEHEKFPEKELPEMKASSLSDIEFKTMTIMMFKELKERRNEVNDNIKKERVSIKK